MALSNSLQQALDHLKKVMAGITVDPDDTNANRQNLKKLMDAFVPVWDMVFGNASETGEPIDPEVIRTLWKALNLIERLFEASGFES